MIRKLCTFFACITFSAVPTFAAVTISSPTAGSQSSPVRYTATATAPGCATGVAAMGIYVNNTLAYQVNAASINTQLTLSPGTYYTVVQEWDHCGGASSTAVTVTIPGGNTQNGLTVTSPANNSNNLSPVSFKATAGSTTCGPGIAAMGVYVNNVLKYKTNGSTLNVNLPLDPGNYNTVVQAWDNCGSGFTKPLTITVRKPTPPSVNFTATSSTITAGSSATLRVVASNATGVVVTGNDGSSYTLTSTGGTKIVTPAATTTYTARATGVDGNTTVMATVTVVPAADLQKINHVVFMLQENRSFDSYFGMLNPYRDAHGWSIGTDGKTYKVDGIENKLTTIRNQNDNGLNFQLFKLRSTCIDDSSSSWLESYGDISRYDFSLNRQISLDGFVHTAQGFTKSCSLSGVCSGTYTDTTGQRVMGYYDQDFLNYYYYMASQFAVSDRWFSPIASKSIPNRIATFSGGTTQGLVFDPGANDHLPQLTIPTIFEKLAQSNVTWKIYYTVTQGACLDPDECDAGAAAQYPASSFSYFAGANKYFYQPAAGQACVAPTQKSSVVGDPSNSFCIDPSHIAPLSTYFTDLTNGTLPSFSFIEAGYGNNDEHPGSGQSNITGQAQVAKVVNAFMASPSWNDSVFFLSYDEGGGPYDHVPPVAGSSNVNTDASLGPIADISQISVNPDTYKPCKPTGSVPTLHCDLGANDPGAAATDAPAQKGFAAQLGFRVPNIVISPFTRKHYVSHTPMDHTAVIKFVETRFLGASASLTARDAAQPNLLEFFDFTTKPWQTPPTTPVPVTPQSLGYDPCRPSQM